jgi:hypothetical protein
MGRSSENWFDRLATPHTRRQGLKAAAVGIAGASLPFARSVPKAQAADPADCRAGCVYTAGKDYERTVVQSSAKYGLTETLSISGFYGLGLSQVYGLLNRYQERTTADRARARYQADFKSCYQPFCPGFDPYEEGGPCSGCDPPLFCNPCSSVQPGYICCVYPPRDCHGDCCGPGPPGGCP